MTETKPRKTNSTKKRTAKTNKGTRRTLGRRTLGTRMLDSGEKTVPKEHETIAPLPEATAPIVTQPLSPSSEGPAKQELSFGRLPHSTQIRINANLFDSVKNAVESAIWGGNYEFESASHFLREALREHATGKPLIVAHQGGPRKQLSLKLDDSLKGFWDTLPKRHRQNILERAVRTKLQEYLA